ncbi:MAG: formate C-acetyltransferase/glycerol dehydratase family glycyl radical enzyme [Eubacteriaceae bacterium]|nr:formate C-acetyltransferase/glycerol dehydratase family glycyl radical enzyme [Eubacteriaceae bacterium]
MADKAYMKRVSRLKKRVLDTTPEVDMEDAVILTKGYIESDGETPAVQKGYAFWKQCTEKSVTIWPDELIVGCSGSKQRGGICSPDNSWLWVYNELDTIDKRPSDPFIFKDEDKKIFNDVVVPYWKGRSMQEKWLKQIPEETKILKECGVLYIDRKNVRGPGELTADYERVVKEGVEGIEARIAEVEKTLDVTVPGDFEKMDYLRALRYCADGLRQLGKRYSAEAKRMAEEEQDPQRKAELLKISEVCGRVPEKPARTFWEAIQSMYIYQIAIFMEHQSASYNPGALDQYLYPYYKADIEAGRLTEDEAQELLDCLWVKFSNQCIFQDQDTAKFSAGYPMFQNVCCGGVDQNGKDAVNDLSYKMLQATMEVQMYQPSLSVKYNLIQNPDKFLKKVVELMQMGTGFPAFHSDIAGQMMVMNKGVPLKDSYKWNPCGCVENTIPGKTRNYTSYADYNLGLAVEFAMNDGKSRKYGRYAGARTGDPRNFKTFDQYMDAVKTQIRHELHGLAAGDQVTVHLQEEQLCPVASLTFDGCIEKALDYSCGGPVYSIGDGVDAIGVADLINSIQAVKELVYDKKVLTMDELAKAIDADFRGYDDILALCQNAKKYGNDDEEVNDLATDMFNYIEDYIETFSNRFGKLSGGILPVSGNTPFGMEVGALPSGRRAWMPLADGVSPNVGTDTNGMSAVIGSVSHIPHGRNDQGTLLNLKLDPAFARGEGAVESLMAFLKSLCAMGIYHVQFNVVDEEELKDAQIHPEDHKDLLIRVAGYTAFFVELSRETQNDIISRTTQVAI